ncbi:hypothetical protein J7M00_00295 [bacterium]|nr:hypothetical protein [bacterium]
MGLFFTPENPIIPYNMGVLFARMGNADSSMYYFRKAIDVEPRFASAKTNIGVLFLNTGNCDSAIYYFKSAVSIDSTNWIYFKNLIAALQQCGKNEELIEKLDYAIEHFKNLSEIDMLKKLRRQIKNRAG